MQSIFGGGESLTSDLTFCMKSRECNNIRAAVFSTTGEMDVIIKNLLLEQIRLKLQLVDGEIKKSKVQKSERCRKNNYFRRI